MPGKVKMYKQAWPDKIEMNEIYNYRRVKNELNSTANNNRLKNVVCTSV